MKLTYLVQYFPPEQASGLQLVEDLLEGFTNYGWDINVYTPTPTRGISGKVRKEYTKKRIEKKYGNRLTIHRMHLYREGKGFISRALRYFLFSVECFWKATTVPADFIFTGSGPPTQGVIVGLAKKFSRKKKVVYNLQDIFPDSLVTSAICSENSFMVKVGRLMENFTYRNADIIITITDDMKENVIRKGIEPEKVKVVRNWIDTERVIPIERGENKLFDEFKLLHNKFYVVYAGNLGKIQGIDVIIDAARQLIDYKYIHFIIFGNGSEEKTVRNRAIGLNNISIFPLQPQEKVSEVYSLGDVSIVSCRPGTGGSGMPSKTWTIMATGTPIIASFDLGGEMERTIKAAKCGYCIEAGNAEMLAEKIRELSKDTDRRKIMGINARKYAEENVSKDKAVKKYIEIIENIVR